MLSCTKKSFETEEELWEYIKDSDNGYFHKKSVKGVTYSLLYKPTDLLVAQELQEFSTKEQINSIREKYDKFLYFNLSMSRENQELLNSVAGNSEIFGAMVKQLAFGMGDKIHLFTDTRDTISMVDYVYPRMYGMSKNTSLLLVYPKEELRDAKEINLTIEDLGFGTGEVRFTQEMKKIINIPNLQL